MQPSKPCRGHNIMFAAHKGIHQPPPTNPFPDCRRARGAPGPRAAPAVPAVAGERARLPAPPHRHPRCALFHGCASQPGLFAHALHAATLAALPLHKALSPSTEHSVPGSLPLLMAFIALQLLEFEKATHRTSSPHFGRTQSAAWHCDCGIRRSCPSPLVVHCCPRALAGFALPGQQAGLELRVARAESVRDVCEEDPTKGVELVRVVQVGL